MTHFAAAAGIALALLVPARAAVPGDPAGWQTLFSASGHVMTTPSAGPWRDSHFHLRVKVISGQLHLYFRQMQCGSYFATLDGGPISLMRMVGCPANYTNLQTASTAFSLGVWHAIDAVAVGGSIKLYLDGALAIDYVDSAPPPARRHWLGGAPRR